MKDTAWQEEVPKYVRVMQIIVGALVFGGVSFLAIVLVTERTGVRQAGDAGPRLVLSYVAFAFLAAQIIAWLVVPRAMVRAGRRNIARGTFPQPTFNQSVSPARRETLEQLGDAGRLLMLFQTKMIVAAAIVEGATLFLIIAYMIERCTPVLVVAIAMIVAIAAHTPTSRGVIDWIEDQLRLLHEERSLER